MAHRIAETSRRATPYCMVCQDGFITSHAIENIELLEDENERAFVGNIN